MNKRNAGFYLILFSLLFVSFLLWSEAETLTIVTEEWAPYNYTENGVLKGFSVEIVKNLILELQSDSTIEVLPSMRATYMLNNNPRTMLFSMMRIPEREKLYKWIGPIGSGAIYFYKRKGSAVDISDLEDAKKVGKIACRNGGLVYNKLKKAGFRNLDTTAINGNQIYRKLLNGRCDLGISDTDLGVKYLLKKMGYASDALQKTQVKVVESDLYIACSKDIPDSEILLWQKALDKLKKSEAYFKIFDKYN